MKHILFITLIAWSLALQASSGAEPFDSLSYAFGDYYTRVVAETEPKLQSQHESEEYVRGLRDGIRSFNQDSTAAEYYGKGLEVGGYILMMMNNGSDFLEQHDLECIADGVRKVADGDISLPQDTIGYYDYMLRFYGKKGDDGSLSDEENCRMVQTLGVMIAAFPGDIGITNLDQNDPDSIAHQQRYATGIIDALKAFGNYGSGLAYAYMVWSSGLITDLDAWVEGIQGALGLVPRRMTIEQVDQCITSWQINNPK